MERTTLRHLTQEEIVFNQKELTCRAEIEKLELQEAQLDTELDQDIDESRKMLALYTLRVLYGTTKARLYREAGRRHMSAPISCGCSLRKASVS